MKKMFALILVAVIATALVTPAAMAAHPNCTEYSADVYTIRSWGGLYGVEISDANINSEIPFRDFVRILTNLFGKNISISGYGSAGISQQEATAIITNVSRQLGQEVTFSGGAPAGRLKRGQACHFVCAYVDVSPKAQQAIGYYYSSGDNSCPSTGYYFTDICPGDWYYQSVCWASSRGICSGKADNRFDPCGTCTMAEFITMIWRAKGSPTGYSSSYPYGSLSANWAYDALCWAGKAGLVLDSSVDPYGVNCSRAAAAQLIWAAAGKPSSSGGNQFRDVPTGATYRNAVNWASSRGIATGNNGYFRPADLVSRAEAVALLHRWLG